MNYSLTFRELEPEEHNSSNESTEEENIAKKRDHSTDDVDDDGLAPTSSTNSRKRRCVRAPVRISSDDTVLSPDMPRSVRRPRRNTPARQRAIKKVKRMMAPKSPKTTPASPQQTPETPPADEAAARSEKEDADTLELIEQYKPPRWLTQIQPVRSPYLPQISDKIYYFVQGHIDYVNSDHCPTESRNVRPWFQRKFLHAQLCQVVSLCFLTGPPTLCQIKLGVLDTSGNIEETFFFRYHDASNIPDFMVRFLLVYYAQTNSRRSVTSQNYHTCKFIFSLYPYMADS